MTFAPGKKRDSSWSGVWDRDLRQDLRRLRDTYRTDVLVSLIEDQELRDVQITDLEAAAQEAGITVRRFPIRDVSVPASMNATRELVAEIVALLAAGDTVVIHCMGGRGRAGLVTACVLVALGALPNDAIRGVREARRGAIETSIQEKFVRDFGKAS